MQEFAPSGGTPRMTKSQVRKYIKEMEERRAKAQLELEKARLSGELNCDQDLKDLEEKIDNL